jgi:hypothetical protein
MFLHLVCCTSNKGGGGEIRKEEGSFYVLDFQQEVSPMTVQPPSLPPMHRGRWHTPPLNVKMFSALPN